MARIANDISLFDILARKGNLPSSTSELAETTMTSPIFLGKLITCQYLFCCL